MITVSTCNLNQWALDFDGNLQRILKSITIAKSHNSSYRIGPELEICGYGCEDHFDEKETVDHCWDSIVSLLPETYDIFCDFGMPVWLNGALYNCRIFVHHGKILGIRPKMALADDGNYREPRWFTAWKQDKEMEEFILPEKIQKVTGQVKVPFGYFFVQAKDVSIGAEICEELFTENNNPHIEQSFRGVQIIGNGSGSHHQLRKLDTRIELIQSAGKKYGGIYLYANQQGCDGGRLYYDGCACIAVNGDIVAQASQFSVTDVEVISATVDLKEVDAYRKTCSWNIKASECKSLHQVNLDHDLVLENSSRPRSVPITVKYHKPQEEIAFGPACWLWDYLRRSGAKGFFLPLSGGADSASVAAIVGIMCHMATEAAASGDEQVQADICRLMKTSFTSTYNAVTATSLANTLLHTTYMGTKNSSQATEQRAVRLATQIGSYHLTLNIDGMVEAVLNTFSNLFGKRPQFVLHGGTPTEDVALQNLQARLRMVTAYMLASLLPWTRGHSGFLLVLGSANVDEALRGYMTKYDCSSADLNPIGGVSKKDLKEFLQWAGENYEYSSLLEIVQAPPTAELRPQAEDATHASGNEEHSQNDEDDMGMTYEELSWFGKLRKMSKCGPVDMFKELIKSWSTMSPSLVAEKVQRFFKYYAINRHKMTTLTPSYHAEEYSPDDNRFDLRPFLYNTAWTRQFKVMDDLVADFAKKAKTENNKRKLNEESHVVKQE